ncbi:MAG: hypothetical protein OQL16_00910 [Gammaproteobacteria bacterium]|nr:hypothetical protein [Gammaproteobacteria bacterium]
MTEPEPRITFDEIDELEGNYLLGETQQEIMLENSADHIAITDHMIAQASRSIRIFTRNLDPVIYDRESILDACKRLALRSRYSRVEILAFDTQSIIHKGHRLVELARTLSSSIEIRRPEKQYEKHLHAFITFDETAYIYRTYADRYDGIANYNDPRETREHEKLFKQIWARSHVDAEFRSMRI